MGAKNCCCETKSEEVAMVHAVALEASPDPVFNARAEEGDPGRSASQSPRAVAADEVPTNLLTGGAGPDKVSVIPNGDHNGPSIGIGSRIQVVSTGELGTIKLWIPERQAWSISLDDSGLRELTGDQIQRAALNDEIRSANNMVAAEPTEEIQDEASMPSARRSPRVPKQAERRAEVRGSLVSVANERESVGFGSEMGSLPLVGRFSAVEGASSERPPETAEQIQERAAWIMKLQEPETSWSLRLVPEHYKDDYDVVLASVERRGEDLEFASRRLRDDKEIVMTAVQQSRRALDHASPRLRSHPDILKLLPRRMSVASADGMPPLELRKASCVTVLCGVTEHEMRAEWMLRAKNGESLEKAPQRFQDDPKIVSAAVFFDPASLQFASGRLRDDDEFVMSCIRAGHKVLQFASERLKYDPEMVAASEKSQWIECLAFGGPGAWLSDAPEHLRDDEDVVMTAARRSCHTNLEYASTRLMDSKEFLLKILEAGTAPSHALQYASKRVCADREVMLMAVEVSLPQHAALLVDLVPQECRTESWFAEFKAQVKQKKDFAAYRGLT